MAAGSWLGIGLLGVLGLSVLCPLVAFPAYYWQRMTLRKKVSFENRTPSHPQTVGIIIPAHNEATMIRATLTSIQRSIQHLQTNVPANPLPKIQIYVGTDGCTDDTAAIARQFPDVSVTEFTDKGSKWKTISTLAFAATEEWIIFTDVGTLWPECFLKNFVQTISAQPKAIGIAPSYQPLNAGWLHRINWQIERTLKRMEMLCGGPVSLHGATVGYKTAPLKEAFAALGLHPWMNDDVVIPLMLRTLHPEGLILYPVGQVQDAGGRHHQIDTGRRKRMLLGNLQWVKALLPSCFGRNPVVAILSMRRLFRVLWAYWFACLAIGLGLSFHALLWPVMIALACLALLSGSFRQLSGAALISWMAPYYFFRSDPSLGVSWK